MHKLCFVLVVALFGCVLSARPDDEIKLVSFNKTLFIANETYQYVLIPQFQVPLQLYRHIIYTATTETVNANIKRTLWQNKKRLLELAPEDHELLNSYMDDMLPKFVKVNQKKRSLPADESGFRSIPLTNNAAVLVQEDPSLKRAGVKLANAICLHVPFFTSCDNKGDLDDVKGTLLFQSAAFRTELDSYKNTNNARASEMAKVLDRQRVLIQALAVETSNTTALIDAVSGAAASNAAQQTHGDMIAHAQINYLQRVTNSLLRYANSLASTDARSVTVQPSLSKLFQGYLSVLTYLKSINVALGKTIVYDPIVDARVFDWTENPLPNDVIKNRTDITTNFISTATLIQELVGFPVVTTVACQDNTPPRCAPANTYVGTYNMFVNSKAQGADHWMLGPIHQGHTGVYPIANTNFTSVTYRPVLFTKNRMIDKPTVEDGLFTPNLYCVDFLGYKALATFTSTPNMLNGIPTPTSSPMTDCNNYRLKDATNSDKTWYLFAVKEGVAIPFYSNCEPTQLISETNTTTPISYLVQYPDTTPTLQAQYESLRTTTYRYLYSTYHVNAEHWVSRNCYLNIEPDWIDLKYYFTTQPKVTTGIPRGYKLNQFTINPAGELASSLEFVYTREWAWAYKVQKTSNNTVLVDEANALDGSLVLFSLNGSRIVDASDAFYGKGNNGRDCIQKADNYEYDLTTCFFQNDEKQYSVDQYLAGNVRTTGIARYADKFNFRLEAINTTFAGKQQETFRFSLTPKKEADFAYTVQTEGPICPKLVAQSTSINSCVYTFYYSGTQTISWGSSSGTAATASVMTVDSNNITSRSVIPGAEPSYYLYAGNSPCQLITCSVGSGSTFMQVASKTMEIVSAADKALVGSVNFAVNQTAGGALREFASIQVEVAAAQKNLSDIISQLGDLDFNTSRIVEYEDFTALRKHVDSLINNLSPTGSRACANGVFGSAGCWFEDALSAIIVIAILAGIGVGIYCACFKFGLIGKLCGK